MYIIAVDTGNRFIKTAHADPFSAGLNRHYTTPPIVATDTLLYNGNYYSFSETQGYHRRDKTNDDYYYILSLAAIARELVMKDAMNESDRPESVVFSEALREASRAKKRFTEEIVLSVGLPPRDMKTLSGKFKNYFLKDGSRLTFTYNDIFFDVTIKEVFVSPQGFAAVFPNDLFSHVAKAPQAYIIDIGGYTTDIAKIVNKRIDTEYFESLDFGVIHMYNEVTGIVAKNHSKNITGVLIEAILRGETVDDTEVENTVKAAADAYAHKIIDALRDKGVDLELSLPVLVGGGVQLMQDSLKNAIDREHIFVIPDVKANAFGYEVLAKRILKEQQRLAY